MIKRAAITFCSGFLVVVGIGALILFQNYQITRQNMELKQQRNELWYSESQLLTLDAEEALDAGNFYLAIQKAVDALPNSELPERPYYAPAEAVLFDALDLFQTHKDRAAYYDVVLEQSTAVEDIFISEDGCKAVTIDQYGVLNCFDTASGILQWSKYISGSDKAGEWILPCGDPSRIACLYRGNLECRDLNTGELIWEYTLEHAFPDCLFYDSQNDVWLCIPYETDLNLDITSISFQIISGKTGAVLRNIPFPQEDNISRCFFTDLYFPYGEPLISGGAFSPDGRYFAGIYGEHHYESESWILKCCLVDIETGVSEICYEGIVDGLYDPAQIGKIEFTDESTALSFVYYTESEINIVKLDVDKIKRPLFY